MPGRIQVEHSRYGERNSYDAVLRVHGFEQGAGTLLSLFFFFFRLV